MNGSKLKHVLVAGNSQSVEKLMLLPEIESIEKIVFSPERCSGTLLVGTFRVKR